MASVSTLSPNGDLGSPSGGGDRYVLFSTWEATEGGKFDGSDPYSLECYAGDYGLGANGGLEDSELTIDWVGTTAVNKPTIVAAPGNEYSFKDGTGFFLTQTVLGQTLLTIASNVYIRAEDIGIIAANNRGAIVTVDPLVTKTDFLITLRDVTVKSETTATTSAAIIRARRVSYDIESCQIVNLVGSAGAVALSEDHRSQTAETCRMVNTILIGSPALHVNTDRAEPRTLINTVLYALTGVAYDGVLANMSGDITNSATTDATWTAVDPAPQLSIDSADFVDFVNRDYTPATSQQLDSNGSNTILPLNDYTGYPFDDPPSIGAFEIQGAATNPTIDTQPTSQVVTEPDAATFTVVATSSTGDTLSYDWKADGISVGAPDSATYNTGATNTGQSGAVITVDVTDVNGTTTSDGNSTLTVNAGAVTVDAQGDVTAQDAETTGQVLAFARVDATGAVVAQGAVTTGQSSVDTNGVLITLTMVNESGTPWANLTGLQWAFFDQALPSTMVAPVDQGTNESTDANGVLTVRALNSQLTPGQTGYFIVSDTDGTEGQDPAQKAFAGPVGTT